MSKRKAENENKQIEKPDDEEGREEEILDAETLNNLEPKVRKLLEVGFSMQRYSGPNPELVKKLTQDHITEIIKQSGTDDHRRYKYAVHGRWFRLAYGILGLGLFVFITFYFGKSNETLYIDIIKIIVAFAGGFGVGIGYNKLIKK